jgi:hypothetical protein
MAQSIGTVKLPIVSTFDPAGVAQAKAGLRDLQQAGQSVAGGGGGAAGGGRGPGGGQQPSPQPATSPYSRLGVGQAVGAVAGEAGLGGLVSAAGATGIVAGAAAASIAIYALSQRAADSAIRLRDNARELHVSTQYYAGLSVAARKAGTDVSTVTSGLSGLHAMAEGAMTGDAGQAIFLESLGIGRGQLAANIGDTAALSRMALAGAHGAQRSALFGSETAARAAEIANGASPWNAPDAGSARSAAQLKVGAEGVGTIIAGELHDLIAGWNHPGGVLAFHDEQVRRADDEARMNAEGASYRLRQQHGAALVGGLLSPYESAARQNQMQSDFVYSGNFEQQQNFQQRAAIDVQQRMNDALRPVRSFAENLEASLDIGQSRWETLGYDKRTRGYATDPLGGQYVTREQQGVARGLSTEVMDYANTMTRAGGLAGALDMNAVGGYSQMVGAEYQQQQSIASRGVAEMLLQQLPPLIAAAIRDSFGFAYRRPAGPMN